MFRIPAFCFVILFCVTASAQRTISGTVVDVSTGQPVAGASVFINNTSKGTVSDRNGLFQLADLPEGQQELIVSSVGYE
ncbi:MAG: carboxypeptidase-like regulatory domain-containing protein, partial [Chitinophagaceae bacterium]